MGRKVRVFDRGASAKFRYPREHRADEWERGASAYTDENVPEGYKNLPSQVVDIDEWLKAHPDPGPEADTRVAVVDGMDLSDANKAALKELFRIG